MDGLGVNKSGPGVEDDAALRSPFPIVAVGASAGGLTVLERIFGALPTDLGAAYIVVQPLAPDLASHMTAALARVTRLRVSQPVAGAELEPNRIYVIPPTKELILAGGKLLLADNPRNAPSLSIDTFFRSLGRASGRHAVAVVLSGTGSDGARGVRAVKSAGGVVIVQDPADAGLDGMPRQASATGVADAVLGADEIAAELARMIPLLASDPGAARQRSTPTPLAKLDVTKRRRAPVEHNTPLRPDGPAAEIYEGLLERYMPMAFLLDDGFRLLHCFRGAERLLSVKGGRMSTSLPELLDGRLKTAVSGLLELFKQNGAPHSANLRGASGERGYHLAISAVPVKRSPQINVLIEVRPLDGEHAYARSEAADLALKAAELETRRLSAIVRNARDAIISHSLDGRIVSWNAGAERVFGYTESEAIGQDVRLVVLDDLQAETDNILAEIKKGHDVAPFETMRRAKDGTRLNVLVSVAPVRNDLGAVTGASVIAIDITARKHAEERAAMAIEQRERFLALLSHELRNPLMAIVSANEVLNRSQAMDPTARRAQQVISRQVTQMSRLLEDTLDTSRMRHDKIELQRKRLDLRSVLDAAMDVARPRAVRESVRLEIESPPGAVAVRADAARMQQVIVNLTQNAIDHSKAGQDVRVALGTVNDTAVIRVEDHGEGIAHDALPHIFEPFFQASRRSSTGMGLGLSLARSIVRTHGGDIVAASAGIGRGACFEVRLPVIDEVGDTTTDLPVLHADGATPPTVVLIDDDAESRESLGILLRDSGYQVLEAEDGARGLNLIEETMPSVAVIDIGLPDISGLEVARRVRRKFGSNQVRLIALTGFGRQDDREAAIEAGCDMHLVKPIDFPTLESVIAYQVSR